MNQKYINYLTAKQRSQNTINAYTKDIEQCLSFISKPDNEITISDLYDWQCSISGSASATVARKTVSVKKYFEYLHRVDIISSDPAIQLDSVRIVNKEKTALTPEQVRAMIDCAKNIRSKAIISMLASTGMRIGELLGLTLEQYYQNPIIILGKGRKYREVYLTNGTREIVDKYIKTRDNACYNLFVSNGGCPMGANHVSEMLKNVAHMAGVENWAEISNHYMRVTAATLQSEAGQPIEVIQDMLGHSNIETTKRYVKVSAKRLERAMTAELF